MLAAQDPPYAARCAIHPLPHIEELIRPQADLRWGAALAMTAAGGNRERKAAAGGVLSMLTARPACSGGAWIMKGPAHPTS